MRTNPYGQTHKRLSLIGFGGMRLPNPANHDEGIALLHAARHAGINYFDTAPNYCEDQSEIIFGKAIRTLPPAATPFYVSSKSYHAKAADFRRGLETSLSRLGLSQITFFHIWCVMSPEDWHARVAGGALREALRAKEEGLIGHLCVSTHMRGPDIAQMLADHPEIEGVTLGYCAINFPYRRAGVAAARQLRRGVVAMNPLGGGLIPRHAAHFDFIRGTNDPDVVTAALRFLASDPGITTALVGFNSLPEIEAAVHAVADLPPYTPEHLAQIQANIEEKFDAMCTGCGYCLPCPQNIPIPQYMETHNHLQLGASPDAARNRLQYHWELTPHQAANCMECGHCEVRCTQHLPIIQRLNTIARLIPQ